MYIESQGFLRSFILWAHFEKEGVTLILNAVSLWTDP